MKSFSTILKFLVLTAASTAIIYGCRGQESGTDTGIARLRISISEAECVTRTSFALEDEDSVKKLLILFYDENRSLVGWKYSAGTVSDGETMDISGLVSGCRYYIFALSGVEMPDDIFGIFGTVDKAERFSWDKDRLKAIEGMPFAYVPSGPVLIESDGVYGISLVRVLARINFMVDCSAMEGSFDVKSLNIRQSPAVTRPLCAANAASRPEDTEDGDSASAQDIITLNEGGRVAYYLMENMQGNAIPGNSDPWSKVPEKMSDGKGALASYVEISGDYRSEGILIRDLKYRFFLGEDIVSNCDIRRNTVQTVTLVLSDANATVKDSWKITPGEVEDSREISISQDTLHIFPYPGREDTLLMTLSPAGLNHTAEVLCANPSGVPFSIEAKDGQLLIRSEKYLPEGSPACIYPVCLSTLDKMHSDTVAIVYHPLDRIEIVLPFEPYSNFDGRVQDAGTGSTVTLHSATASERSDASSCLNFIFDYGGILKSTLSNGAAGRDTVYERGLVLSSSDGSIITSALSPTNPTLWYLQAHGPGSAGLSAEVTMGGTTVEGSRDMAVHVLSLALNAISPIGVGASCSPSVSLTNESGRTFAALPEALSYCSQNRNVLTDRGLGIAEGQSVLTAVYAGSGTDRLSDSREIRVSNSADVAEYLQLVIAPSASQSLYVGESRRDTAYLVHYVNGAEDSRTAVVCDWSISDPDCVSLGSVHGTNTLLTGLKASSGAVTLNATYTAGNGISYRAKADIYVSAPVFYTDRQSMVWLANEKEAGCAKSVNITASPTLRWTAALSGTDHNYFEISRSSGTGPGSISVYPVMENANYNNDRTATLTLSADGAAVRTVSLRHRRDSLLKLNIVPHDVTLDLNADADKADTLLRLTTDWLSGRSGVSIPNSYAEWSSSAPEVAASAGYGKVVAYGPGTAGIKASWRSVSDTARIRVINTGSYDTTYIVRIRPETDQSISWNGSVQFSATAQMLVNTRYIGEPFDVTASSQWISTVPAAANVNSGLAVGCNTGTAPLQTMICASYKGFESNYVLLNAGSRAGDVRSIRLEIRSFLMDEEGRTTLWKDGYISAAVYQPGDNTYNNGEQSQWCTIHGGTHYDTEVSIEVALYATMNSDGQEHLLGTRTFTFSAMRGDRIDFDQNDWPDIFNTDNFTFKATIIVD